MNRVTPEKALVAFTKAGIKPMQDDFIKDGCGCLLTAICMSQNPTFKEEIEHNDFIEDFIMQKAGFSGEYSYGLMMGFDGADRSPPDYWGSDYEEGYRDGQAAWDAVKHLAE